MRHTSSTRQASTWRGRRRLPVVLLAVLLLAPPLAAQEAAMDYIKPLLDRTTYEAMCRQLDMDREQRQIVDLLYQDYLGNVDALARRIDIAADAAGRQRVADAFAGRARMRGDELRELRRKVLQTYVPCGRDADELLESFLAGMEGMLKAEQRSGLEASVQAMRRRVLLHPRQAGSRTFTYAGEGVDVLQLVDDARQRGGELANLDEDGMHDTLAQYGDTLDRVLTETVSSYRDHQMASRIARLAGDDEMVRRSERAMLEAWTSLYHVNRETADRIGAQARSASGEWSERLWLDRFNRASFAWLYTPRNPDKQMDWIRTSELDEDIRQNAELKYNLYLAERDALQQEAIAIIIEARLERGIVLHQLSNPREVEDAAGDLYKKLLRNSGAVTSLDSKYVTEIESLLDDESRKELRRVVSIRRR